MAQVKYLGLFPMCIEETSDTSLVGLGTAYPVGFALEDAMTFFWKAKKFNIAGNIQITYTDNSVQKHHSFDINDNYTFDSDNNGFIPQSELDYVCIALNTGMLLFDSGSSGSNTVQYSGPWQPYGGNLGAVGQINAPVMGYKIGSLYYMCCWWTLTTAPVDSVPQVLFDSYTPEPSSVYSGNVNFVINGNTYHIPFITRYSGIDSVDSCSLTLTISEEWAFNP